MRVVDGHIALLRNFPVTEAMWLSRCSGALLHDLFVAGGVDGLGQEALFRAVVRMSARTVDILEYAGPSVAPETRSGVLEVAMYRAVEEQLAVHGLGLVEERSSYRRSHLWAAYAAVCAAHGATMTNLVVMLCRADLWALAHGTGNVVLGPSTVLGAGLGAICVGVHPAVDHHYFGPERLSAEVSDANVYRVQKAGDVVIDGSYIGCVANTMNSRRYPNMMLVHMDDGRVWATPVDREGRIASEELFVNYGAPPDSDERSVPVLAP